MAEDFLHDVNQFIEKLRRMQVQTLSLAQQSQDKAMLGASSTTQILSNSQSQNFKFDKDFSNELEYFLKEAEWITDQL